MLNFKWIQLPAKIIVVKEEGSTVVQVFDYLTKCKKINDSIH